MKIIIRCRPRLYVYWETSLWCFRSCSLHVGIQCNDLPVCMILFFKASTHCYISHCCWQAFKMENIFLWSCKKPWNLCPHLDIHRNLTALHYNFLTLMYSWNTNIWVGPRIPLMTTSRKSFRTIHKHQDDSCIHHCLYDLKDHMLSCSPGKHSNTFTTWKLQFVIWHISTCLHIKTNTFFANPAWSCECP